MEDKCLVKHGFICEVSALLTKHKHTSNKSDPTMAQKWLWQTDPLELLGQF